MTGRLGLKFSISGPMVAVTIKIVIVAQLCAFNTRLCPKLMRFVSLQESLNGVPHIWACLMYAADFQAIAHAHTSGSGNLTCIANTLHSGRVGAAKGCAHPQWALTGTPPDLFLRAAYYTLCDHG